MPKVEPSEKQTTNIPTTKDRFDELVFSRTAGYLHYSSTDSDDLAKRRQSIDEFLNNDSIEEPDVEPRKHTWETINQTIQEYELITDEILKKPYRTPRDEAELDMLIQKTGELFRYEELMLAMGAASLDERDEHRRLAADLSIEIIGGINRAAFSQIVNETVNLAAESDSETAKELGGLISLQDVEGAAFESYDLEAETRRIIGSDLVKLYPGIDELYGTSLSDSDVSPEQLAHICQQLFSIAGFDPSWKAELNDGDSASTAGKDKRVYIGKNREHLKSQNQAVGLAFHEAIVHGSRSQGEQLPGTLNFEEGLATRLQQIISGEVRTPGTQYYLAIGLQAGIDRGGEPRSYRETFEILWRREVLIMKRDGKEFDVAAARSNAQKQVHRTRRGGAVDTRDSSYFIGAQKAAAWLNDIAKLPEEERIQALSLVINNRIDPTNPEHIAFMQSAE